MEWGRKIHNRKGCIALYSTVGQVITNGWHFTHM